MPIFEFRCVDCGHVFEMLLMNSQEEVKMGCPECRCESLDRVVSRTNYTIGGGKGGNRAEITTKSCGSGNECMTLDLPGHTK